MADLARATEFAFPDRDLGYERPLLVQWRGIPYDMLTAPPAGGWAVVRGAKCYNRDGAWELEPPPSSRDDAFFARCRFTLDEAYAIAEDLTATHRST